MPKKKEFIPCTAMVVPPDLLVESARLAVEANPVNAPSEQIVAMMNALFSPEEAINRIAVLTTAFWGAGGVKLGVAFLDNPPTALRSRVIAGMNVWGSKGANIKFAEVAQGNAEVRIARANTGYWSYLGTQILSIRQGATMNLQGFSANTPEAEFKRVLYHETGHTLGCPHEHMRRDIIARLDPQKTIEYFRRTQGWSQQQVMQQVLTPIEEGALLDPPQAEETSIMTYQLPGSITRDGRPIPGGADITATDFAYMAKIHPGTVQPPPPSGDRPRVTMEFGGNRYAGTLEVV